MKKKLSITLSLLIIFQLPNCTKNYIDIIKGPEEKFYQGKFRQAAKMIIKKANKKGKNQLLYLLEAGYMLHAAGDYKNSNKFLLKAANLAKVKKISVGKQIASVLSNERVTNYNGEDFEVILLHMYLGINFLMLKKYDSARVEFKSVNDQVEKIKSENKYKNFKENLMARYLSAIAFEIIGQFENDKEDLEYAYIEYKKIYKSNPGLKIVHKDLARLSKTLQYMDDYKVWINKFGKTKNPPKDYGELIVILQAGQGAIKQSRGKLLSDVGMKGAIVIAIGTINLAAGVTGAAILATLATAEHPFPIFKKRSNMTDHLNIVINGNSNKTSLLENIELTAIKTLEENYTKLQNKLAASIAVKAATSVAAGFAAREATKAGGGKRGLASCIGFAAGIGTGAILFSQMQPDLRCWHTLPAKLHVSRILLKPGKHTITIEFIDKNKIIQNKKQIDFEIKKGQKVFINERTLF